MWEPDGSSVMSSNVWDLCLANTLSDNLAKLESSLLGVNSMGNESTIAVE